MANNIRYQNVTKLDKISAGCGGIVFLFMVILILVILISSFL